MVADDEERRALQRRLYGPDADPGGDPDAQRRLRELDAAASASLTDPPPPGSPTAEQIPVDREPPRAADPPGAASPRAVAAAASSPGASRRAGWAVLWAATLLTALVVALVVLLVVPRATETPTATSPYPGEVLVATLARDESFEPLLPEMHGYDEFFGMRPFVNRSDTTTLCLWATDPTHLDPVEGGWSSGAPAFSGCGAGVYPATLFFAMDSTLPAPLIEEFPFGSAFRMSYIAERDVVEVFVAYEPDAR